MPFKAAKVKVNQEEKPSKCTNFHFAESETEPTAFFMQWTFWKLKQERIKSLARSVLECFRGCAIWMKCRSSRKDTQAAQRLVVLPVRYSLLLNKCASFATIWYRIETLMQGRNAGQPKTLLLLNFFNKISTKIQHVKKVFWFMYSKTTKFSSFSCGCQFSWEKFFLVVSNFTNTLSKIKKGKRKPPRI